MSTESDRKQIEDTVMKYFHGMKNADVELLKTAFHEQAGFFGPFGDQIIAAPISGLYEWVSNELAPGAGGKDHALEFDSIEVEGPIGLVKCRERGFMGHDFAEFFTLLKVDDQWKITNKSYSAIA